MVHIFIHYCEESDGKEFQEELRVSWEHFLVVMKDTNLYILYTNIEA